MRIEEISIDSKKYPQKLRNIYDPPKKLYVEGYFYNRRLNIRATASFEE